LMSGPNVRFVAIFVIDRWKNIRTSASGAKAMCKLYAGEE
jgi:hypothetical protein